jgi:erythromycin esterase
MAANVGVLLEAEGPHAKALLWAHNAHVQRAPYVLGELMMGGLLHSDFGAQQVVIGFGFNQGGFRAVGKRGSGQIVDHVVGPAPAGYVDAALARTGFPLLALDLRRVPSIGPVADWMASKPLQRHVEAVFMPDYEMVVDRMVADDPRNKYDLLLFVETTTPARSIWRS